MFFVTEHWFDLSQNHVYDTIEVKLANGYVEPDAYDNFVGDAVRESSYFIMPDSIRLNVYGYSIQGGSLLPVLSYLLYPV